jgi:diguanylate cyclase (GGDEF)-like protein
MAVTTTGVRATTLRVVALTAVLATVGALPAFLEPSAAISLDGYVALPWWMLATLFGVTEACVLRVRTARTHHAISLSEVPLVMGLFLAEPLHLLSARLVGVAVVLALRRRQPTLTVLFSLALAAAGTAAALATFAALLGGAEPLSGQGCLAALAGAAVGGLLDVAAVLLVMCWYGDQPGVVDMLRVTGLAVAAPALVGIAGVVPVLAFSHGEAALPVAVTGAVALLGYRTYAVLADRHASLGRLYELSDALAVAPASADVVPPLLRQSAELLRAAYAEVVLAGLGPEAQVWSVRHRDDDVTGPVPAAPEMLPAALPDLRPDARARGGFRLVRATDGPDAVGFLAARGVSEALVVPLRIDDRVSGHVLVADRVGVDRTFGGVDGRLLETVANHGSVALRNGRLIERLHFEARHDELTGLPNRLDFRTLLAEAARRAWEAPFAVMVLDFNGFKAVNDTLGHQAGDDLLRVLAARFTAAVGDDAVVARLGGDEFAVLAPGCADAVTARALAARLLKVFDTAVEVGGTRLRVGGSLGVALAPEHATTASDLLRQADLAMYAAKSAAGGCRIFSPDLATETLDGVRLAADLRDAVESDDFAVVVQPIIDLETGLMHSVEVLARWHHPELGPIAPQEFFAAAERSNQTTALSMRILDRALRAARDWHLAGHPIRVAVNLAARWLTDPSLPEQVGAALARHGVPADLLSLEVTETAVIGDGRRATATLKRLRELGVLISVDDFGTGYSSLTHLARLPVDQMKIDKSFVQHMYDSPRDRAVVRSIIDLGRNLGLDVVAEGVTAPGTRRALQEMGCRLAQGFLFAEPVPVTHVPRLVERYGVVPRAQPGPSTPLPRRPVKATVLPDPADEITPQPAP